MTDRIYTGIQKVLVGAVWVYNILDVDIWAITDEGNEDLVEVKFTPNTIEGIAFKQYAKAWLIKIVHDGWTDVWDPYISYDGEGTVLPAFGITFETVVDGVAGTEIWTFEASKCYVSNRDEVGRKVEETRTPGTIYVLCIGTATPS